MTRFEDLPEECLRMVLKELSLKEKFKMLRVNKQINRLVSDEMRNNVKSIAFVFETNSEINFSQCTKHGSSNMDQLLLFPSPQSGAFLSVLSKCTGVKHFNFGYSELPCYLFFEVFRRCPELECIKMSASVISEKGWGRVLTRFGKQIVHFSKSWYKELPESTCLLKIFAANCPNIKEIDWIMNNRLTGDFVKALNMLPKNCKVSLLCGGLPEENTDLPDAVDELQVKTLVWSSLGKRIDRLSWIRFTILNPGDGPVHGVDFAGLKNFDASACGNYNTQLVSCISASRFPELEEFGFRTNLLEDEYSAVFKQMSTVKKLTIIMTSHPMRQGVVAQLPQTASIQQLKNLKAIDLEFRRLPNDWKPDNLLKQVERYINEIRSLKKLTVALGGERLECSWQKKVTDEINRMKLKQTRVEISFSDKRLISYKNEVLVLKQRVLLRPFDK